MIRRRHLVVASISVTLVGTAHADAWAEDRFIVEAFLGASASFDTNLELTQAGQPVLEFTGQYESRSFEFPLYYALRLGGYAGVWGIELQLVHHKVHLSNPPSDVQQFEISHGFNLLTANGLIRSWPVDVRLGLGVVVAHPESIVRNQIGSQDGGIFGNGYHLTGPAFVAGVGRAFPLASRLVLIPEVFVSAARVRVPIAAGEASLVDVAFHATLGVGLRL